jgi:lysine biosynthesis protein LysW
MALATCPGCDEDIQLTGRARLGQTVICDRCGARLEIISVAPAELDWAFDESDDLEDDSDDFDYDEEEEDEESEDSEHDEGEDEL